MVGIWNIRKTILLFSVYKNLSNSPCVGIHMMHTMSSIKKRWSVALSLTHLRPLRCKLLSNGPMSLKFPFGLSLWVEI